MADQPEPPILPPAAGTVASGNLSQQAGGDLTGRDRIGRDRIGRDQININLSPAPVQATFIRRVPSSNIPGRPARFVPRAELLAQARAALLEPAAGQGARMVGLVGMGGTGKSVLARELARDEWIRAAFPDGIVWLELGPNPDLVARQAELVEALGDPRPPVDIQQGCNKLNTLLTGAAALVVVDNVWQAKHLRAFDLLEPACALLVTTRDQDVLDHAARACRVELLAEPAARELLAAWAKQDPASLPSEADRVVEECRGLPLALAVAGGLVGDGRSWRNVSERLRRADLDKLTSRFRDYPYPDVLRALEASVSALDGEQRARYQELAVFEGRGGVPVEAVQLLWQQAGLDDLDSEDLAVLLARRSLVQHDPANNTITLHDLQFDYVRRELGDARVAELHACLAAAFLSSWGGLDQQLPDLQAGREGDDVAERYGLVHLVAHLAAAGRVEQIHSLLALSWPKPTISGGSARAGNAWHVAHERIGETAAYLGDVRIAWRLAKAATDTRLKYGQLAGTIGLEIRYALISASIVSIANKIPVPLLAALVSHGIWTPAQALAYTRENPSPWAKAVVPAALAPHLSEPDRLGILSEALTAARTINWPDDPAQVLAVLVPHLPAALLPDALAAIHAIEEPDRQARALTALAPHLSEPDRLGILSEALTAARTITHLYVRARTLLALAPHLPEPDRLAALSEALAVLAPHLPAALPAEALTAASAIDDSDHRAQTLAALAPHLPAALLPEALTAASAIDDSGHRARALAALAPHLPEADRITVLDEALTAASAIDWPGDRAQALAALAPHLPAALLPDALIAARTINDLGHRAQTLITLAPHLPMPDRLAVLDEALTAAQTIDDLDGRTKAIGTVVRAAEQIGFLPWEPHWRSTSVAAAIQGRASVADNLIAISGMIAHFGGAEAIRASVQALGDVLSWWP